MSPNLQEESLVDRETDSSVLTLDTCSEWTAVPAVARSWAAHRAARKVYRLEFSGEIFLWSNCGNNGASRAKLRYLRYPICLSFTLVPLHLSFVLGDQRRGVPS